MSNRSCGFESRPRHRDLDAAPAVARPSKASAGVCPYFPLVRFTSVVDPTYSILAAPAGWSPPAPPNIRPSTPDPRAASSQRPNHKHLFLTPRDVLTHALDNPPRQVQSPQATARGKARSASVFDHSILKQTEVQIEIIVQYISKVIDRAYGRIETFIPTFWQVKCG